IAVGALRAGLKLNWDAGNGPGEGSELGEAKRLRRATAPYRIKADPRNPRKAVPLAPWAFDGIGLVTGYADRVGRIPGADLPKNPQAPEELSAMALDRRAADPKYRPATLRDVFPGEKHPPPPYRIVAGALKWAAIVAFWGIVAYLLWRAVPR
ncbi:MAG: hypothetical protein KIS90_17045, partial [Phenylobacterium sp.]|nr:hypothetical protein [Phenylobacterium sp.]